MLIIAALETYPHQEAKLRQARADLDEIEADQITSLPLAHVTYMLCRPQTLLSLLKSDQPSN